MKGDVRGNRKSFEKQGNAFLPMICLFLEELEQVL